MDAAIFIVALIIVIVFVIIIQNRKYYRDSDHSIYINGLDDYDEDDDESSPYDRNKLTPISSKLPPPKEGGVKEGINFYSYSGGDYRICPVCEAENSTDENMCRICGNRFR